MDDQELRALRSMNKKLVKMLEKFADHLDTEIRNSGEDAHDNATLEVNKKTKSAIRLLFATLQKTEFAVKTKADAARRCALYLFEYSLPTRIYSRGDALFEACFLALKNCQGFEALKFSSANLHPKFEYLK